MIDKLYKLAWIPVLLIIVVIAWPFVAPRLGIGEQREARRDLDPFREHLANEAAREAASKLPRLDDVHRLVLPPVEGDATRWLQEILAEAIEDDGFYDVVDLGDLREKRKEKLKDKDPLAREDWLLLARELKADAVLFARAEAFSEGRRGVGAKCALDLALARASDGAPLPEGKASVRREIGSRASLDYFTPFMQSSSVVLRLLAWLLLAAGLPFALYPAVKGVAGLESNKAAAFLVLGMTALDLLAGVALMGFAPGGFGIVLLAVGGLVVLVYNLAMGNRLADLR